MRMLTLLLAVVLLQAKSDEPHIHAAAEALQQGKAAVAKKQLDSAVAYFERAIEIEPTFMEARKDLIRAELEAGQKLEAAKSLTQLLEIDPDDLRSRVLLGQILLDQQQTQRAQAQFSAALSLEPDDADALLGFAIAASRLGMTDRAKDALERGRKKYPSDPRFQPKPSH
jgi:tetratricopeptide (TPR) repeat protein